MFQNNKKMFLYEVDPLFFCDSNKDGFGDFKGFLKKIEYFDFLDIDGIIFPDIFNQEEIILKTLQTSIYDKYGSMSDLRKIINYFKKINKYLIIEINIKNIVNSFITKTTIEELTSNDISKYIEIQDTTYNNDSKWITEKKIEAFKKVINFWINAGIQNFIFTNFDDTFYDEEKLNTNVIEQLETLYKITKENNPNISIGIKSLLFTTNDINLIFKKYLNIICDFVVDASFSLIGTEKKYEFDILKKFNPNKIIKKIKNLNINEKDFSKYIISFNNNKIGRVNSRWLNEEDLFEQANKTLILLKSFTPFSTINYYGEEIGLLRMKIENQKDFLDYEYNEKKRRIEFNKFKIGDFEYSQKFLSRINSQSLFPWNDQKNFGFSEKDKLFRKNAINAKRDNLKNQFNNPWSIFNFYKDIITIWKNSISTNNIKKETFSVSHSKELMFLRYRIKKNAKIILINLSNKAINKKINKKWNVVLSTLPFKDYSNGIKVICPYESMILIKNK